MQQSGEIGKARNAPGQGGAFAPASAPWDQLVSGRLGFGLRHGEEMRDKGEVGVLRHSTQFDTDLRNVGGGVLRRWRSGRC